MNRLTPISLAALIFVMITLSACVVEGGHHHWWW
jgi:hypothetical protein